MKAKLKPRHVSSSFIEWAKKRYKPWDLANNVIYKLCTDHPTHESAEAIIAKFWIIGRTYAAALERRRVTGKVRGDDLYTKA